MMTDAGAGTADREARNEYLISIDEKWEMCRDSVEQARITYEEALDFATAMFETQQTEASSAHQQSLDEAWTEYKRSVTDSPAFSRKGAISEARGVYNESATKTREAFEAAVALARDEYAGSLKEARLTYEAAVDESFSAHREAIRRVHTLAEPHEGGEANMNGHEGDENVDYVELAELAARVSGDGHSSGSENGAAHDIDGDEAGLASLNGALG